MLFLMISLGCFAFFAVIFAATFTIDHFAEIWQGGRRAGTDASAGGPPTAAGSISCRASAGWLRRWLA